MGDRVASTSDHEIYPSAPLAEAVCDIRFVDDSPWDPVFPGTIYARVQHDYPTHLPIPTIETNVSSHEDVFEHHLTAVARSRFVSADKTSLVQVGPNTLGVSQLTPYPGWREYKRRLLSALQVYCEVATPQMVGRIGLRYINRFPFADVGVEMRLQDYFNIYPEVLLHPYEGQPISNFILGFHLFFNDGRDAMRVRLSDLARGTGEIQFVLDIEYFLNSQGGIAVSEIEDWLELAHTEISATFEASVVDTLKEQFRDDA